MLRWIGNTIFFYLPRRLHTKIAARFDTRIVRTMEKGRIWRYQFMTNSQYEKFMTISKV